MDILTLSKSLSKSEFKEALFCIEKVNDAGLLLEFIDLVNGFVRQGTDLDSAIHHANYDLLIDLETGKYKKEIENLVTGSGGNYGF